MSAGAQGVGDGSEGADGCSEGTRPYLVAGEWKGTFKLVYEPIVPGMPKGIKTKVTWSGEMSFDVARPEKSDAPPPEKPNRRRPLAPPLKEGEKPPVTQDPDRAAPGQFKNDDEQRAAVIAWYTEQGRKAEEAANERARRYGTQIPPPGSTADKPQVNGGGKGKIAMSLSGVPGPGTLANADLRQTDEVTFELSAVEENAEQGIKRLEVKGDSGASFTYNIAASGHGLHGSKSGSTNSQSSGKKIRITFFEIEDLQCGVVTGHLDSTMIRELTRKNLPGYDMRIIENTWTATYEDRDEALEHRVEDLVSRPLPAQLSWGYLDQFTSEAAEVRASVKNPTDYHRCVLKALEGKFVKICRAMIKELGKNFPNAEFEPSCELLRQAMAPIYQIQRSLELYGAGGCPEVVEAWQNVEKQVQRTVKFALQKNPGFTQLSCYNGLATAGLLGDVAEQYDEALKAAEWAARGKK